MKFLLFALLAVSLCFERFDNHKVLRINITSEEELSSLHSFESLQKIDIWTENAVNQQFDVRIPHEFSHEFQKDFIQKYNTKYTILIDNLQKILDLETNAAKSKVLFEQNTESSQFFTNFRTLEEINNWVKQQAQTKPNLCKIITVGKSYEGREILGLKIHSTSSPSKGSILIHGGIHAREWISPSTVAWIAFQLLEKYNTDPMTKRLVDNLEFHVFPVLNVDGYHFTHTGNRMWRKTRKPNPNSSCIGVDPNRNWAYKWNTGGSSDSPCSDAFHGPAPNSEQEVRQMAEYGDKLPNLKGYIDYHAYGQLWMRPWGWSKDAPTDEARLKKIGDETADAISRVRGKRYQSGRISIIIYIASGSSADYFYGKSGINAFGVELGTGFIMAPSEIPLVGNENWEAF